MCVDLHTHSTFSDGTATPAELVQLAHRQGLTALALTDHDTADGLRELEDEGARLGLTVLPGIEISARHHDHHVHILGYGIDPASSALHGWLERIQQGREERNRKIVELLNRQGYPISQDELAAISPLGQTGRPHIARLLVSKGMTASLDQTFHTLLGRGKPAYAPRFLYSAAETITSIHRAGGLAVLAHPGQLDPGFRLQPRLVAELALRGLDGLEVYYPSHGRTMRKKLLGLARRHRLLTTGGSDFHGHNRPKNTLAGTAAFCPPDHILEALKSRLAGYPALSTIH